jgi:hypothetical protein
MALLDRDEPCDFLATTDRDELLRMLVCENQKRYRLSCRRADDTGIWLEDAPKWGQQALQYLRNLGHLLGFSSAYAMTNADIQSNMGKLVGLVRKHLKDEAARAAFNAEWKALKAHVLDSGSNGRVNGNDDAMNEAV